MTWRWIGRFRQTQVSVERAPVSGTKRDRQAELEADGCKVLEHETVVEVHLAPSVHPRRKTLRIADDLGQPAHRKCVRTCEGRVGVAGTVSTVITLSIDSTLYAAGCSAAR